MKIKVNKMALMLGLLMVGQCWELNGGKGFFNNAWERVKNVPNKIKSALGFRKKNKIITTQKKSKSSTKSISTQSKQNSITIEPVAINKIQKPLPPIPAAIPKPTPAPRKQTVRVESNQQAENNQPTVSTKRSFKRRQLFKTPVTQAEKKLLIENEIKSLSGELKNLKNANDPIKLSEKRTEATNRRLSSSEFNEEEVSPTTAEINKALDALLEKQDVYINKKTALKAQIANKKKELLELQ